MGYLWPYPVLINLYIQIVIEYQPLLPLLAESSTYTLNEMGSCKVVYKHVRYSMCLCMGWDFGKAGIDVA